MTALKSVSEVVHALGQQYSGPIKTVKGSGGGDYDYISWDDAVREMDKVFGPLGWDNRVSHIEAHPQYGVYIATTEVTGRAVDDETGQVVTFTRAGLGRAVARASKAEYEENGRKVSSDPSIHDTAAATAESDSFTRATKKLGDAFGLYLYQKKQGNGGGSYGGGRSNGGGNGEPATGPQLGLLRKKGVAEEELEGLTKRAASEMIERLNGGSSGARKQPVAAGADLPW